MNAADGTYLEGEFRNDMLNGFAKVNYVNGSTYRGYFKNGVWDGVGTLKYADGSEYNGLFKMGIKVNEQPKTPKATEWKSAPTNNVNTAKPAKKKGVLSFTNGNEYNGEIKNKLPRRQRQDDIFRWQSV